MKHLLLALTLVLAVACGDDDDATNQTPGGITHLAFSMPQESLGQLRICGFSVNPRNREDLVNHPDWFTATMTIEKVSMDGTVLSGQAGEVDGTMFANNDIMFCAPTEADGSYTRIRNLVFHNKSPYLDTEVEFDYRFYPSRDGLMVQYNLLSRVSFEGTNREQYFNDANISPTESRMLFAHKVFFEEIPEFNILDVLTSKTMVPQRTSDPHDGILGHRFILKENAPSTPRNKTYQGKFVIEPRVSVDGTS